jgi:hypothetical protein
MQVNRDWGSSDKKRNKIMDNTKVLQQSQYKIARVTGLLHEDHNDLSNSILNDRHIYDVVV